MEDLASLRPVFENGGTVTAGNSSGINDGAAAVTLMSWEEANKKNLNKEPTADIQVISSVLRSIELNDRNLISSAIDEFPAIFILAAFARGKSSFDGLNGLATLL